MSELKPNTRAAIYGRVSTRDKGQEVENQLAQLREFAAKQGWTISCEYADRESGANRDPQGSPKTGHTGSPQNRP
jgi:DNA invertase Pin-like site-specific DNA recombinase